MNQTNKTKEAIIWLILLSPFLYALLVWHAIPERVPIHFDANGAPDGYSGKTFALLLVPVMNILIYFVLFFVPRIDPRKKNYAFFGSSYQNIRLIVHLFLAGLFIFITQTTAGGQRLQVNGLFSAILLFLALLGNYMRTVRSNFFVGIRTPWTLSSDIVWRKTHELGGRIWFYCGISLGIIIFFLPPAAATIVMICGICIMVITPVVYSYIEFVKISGNK